MSNKTQLQANNETLASILSNVLGLPSQESLKHGAYVWKKLTKPIMVTFVQTSYNPIKFTVSSGDIDLGSVDESWFVGIKCSYSWATAVYAFEFMENNVFVIWTADGKSHLYEGTYSYNPSNKTITTDINPPGSFGINSSATKQENFLDFAVSDNPTAYPDVVEQDGYWYEKVVEGIDLSALGWTKCAIDYITPSTNIYIKNSPLRHSLGIAPKYIHIKALSTVTTTSYDLILLELVGCYSTDGSFHGGKMLCRDRNGSSEYTPIFSSDSEKIVISDAYLIQGVQYRIITIG